MLNPTRNAYRNMPFKITQNNIKSHLNSDVKQGSEYNLVLLTRVGRPWIVIIHIWHKADLDRGVNALASCREDHVSAEESHDGTYAQVMEINCCVN